jgi:hypothetical protein
VQGSTIKDLDRLAEAEVRLDELLRTARAEAADLIAHARHEAGRAEEHWAADFETARRDLERRVADERDRELARIQGETERLAAHYAGQSPDVIESLAAWVAGELRAPTVRGDGP